jgi:hypothetical protein
MSFGSLPLNGQIKSFPDVWQFIINFNSFLFFDTKSLNALVSGSEKGFSPGQKSPHNSVVF